MSAVRTRIQKRRDLDDWGTDARSLGYSAVAFHQRGGVTGDHSAATVKRGFVYRLDTSVKTDTNK